MISIAIMDAETGQQLSHDSWGFMPQPGNVIALYKKMYEVIRIQELPVVHVWVRQRIGYRRGSRDLRNEESAVAVESRIAVKRR